MKDTAETTLAIGDSDRYVWGGGDCDLCDMEGDDGVAAINGAAAAAVSRGNCKLIVLLAAELPFEPTRCSLTSGGWCGIGDRGAVVVVELVEAVAGCCFFWLGLRNLMAL